jgi:hypothetical protein
MLLEHGHPEINFLLTRTNKLATFTGPFGTAQCIYQTTVKCAISDQELVTVTQEYSNAMNIMSNIKPIPEDILNLIKSKAAPSGVLVNKHLGNNYSSIRYITDPNLIIRKMALLHPAHLYCTDNWYIYSHTDTLQLQDFQDLDVES